MTLDRCGFLRVAAVGVGATALGGSLWREAAAGPAVPGPTRYGRAAPQLGPWKRIGR